MKVKRWLEIWSNKKILFCSDDFNKGTSLSSLHYEESEFLIWHVSIIDKMDAGFKT